MAYPYTPQLSWPLSEYSVNSYQFGERCQYDGVDWEIHLGEDCDVRAGTSVRAIGRGKVVYSASRLARQDKKTRTWRQNWGGIVIIAHKHPRTKEAFFSLYGHLGQRAVRKGQRVMAGQIIGEMGRKNSAENGYWESHSALGSVHGAMEGQGVTRLFRVKPETHPEKMVEGTNKIHKIILGIIP